MFIFSKNVNYYNHSIYIIIMRKFEEIANLCIRKIIIRSPILALSAKASKRAISHGPGPGKTPVKKSASGLLIEHN